MLGTIVIARTRLKPYVVTLLWPVRWLFYAITMVLDRIAELVKTPYIRTK
jgi:hypothetical protein